MKRFRVGDRVVVVRYPVAEMNGQVGRVEANSVFVRVPLPSHGGAWLFYERELEHAPSRRADVEPV